MSTLLELFSAPGAEYRGKPFWSWNGELRADELARQVGIMKEMGLGGYFMHSRAGLITEYLGWTKKMCASWTTAVGAGKTRSGIPPRRP